MAETVETPWILHKLYSYTRCPSLHLKAPSVFHGSRPEHRRAVMQRTDSCVVSLIAAFTSGLDVFKKLRERKREKKSKKARAQTLALQGKSGEELVLSKSLRRGSADIHGEYEKHYRGYGERFAVGDRKILPLL